MAVLVEYSIQVYQTATGKCPYSAWLKDLIDLRAKAKIRVRIDRLQMGNFGQCEPVGDGVSELKIDFGPGYRIYFGMIGKTCVLLLTGGTKKTQSSDIKRAKEYFVDYKARRD
jgi:putative addiction module killer protein